GEQIEQLKEKDALRRKLVAHVSHDLRTPLASMQGHLETLQLKSGSFSDEEREQFLQTTITQGWRLSRLVNELFELSSLDAKEQAPDREPFAANELVYDVVQKRQLEAAQKNLSLSVNAANHLPMAYGDLAMTERVMDNLMDNAFAHTPAGGRVEVQLKVEQSSVNVSVINSGPGIPKEALAHLFEPFYRAEEGLNRSHAGLGLAIAKRIMELQKGSLEAFNGSDGGAVFRFSLPLFRGQGE
ncbi:sensor histidine kinase, partial [Pseudomonadota bacterium]